MAPVRRSSCARPGQSLGCRIAASPPLRSKPLRALIKPRALVWIADGLEQGGAAEFAAALREAAAAGAGVEVLRDDAAPLALRGRRQRQRRPGGLGAARRAEGRRRGRGARRQGAAGRQGAFPIRRLRPDEGAFRSADRIAQRGELFARGGGKFRRRRGLARLARAGAARRDCRRRRRRRGAALAVGGLLSRKGARAVHAAAEIQSRRRRPGSGRPGRPPQRSGAGRRKGRAGRGLRGLVELCRAGRGVAAFRRAAPRQRPRRSDAGQAAPQRARARRRDVVGYAQAARRFRRGQPVFRARRPRRRRREHGRFWRSPTPASPPRPGRGSPTARRSRHSSGAARGSSCCSMSAPTRTGRTCRFPGFSSRCSNVFARCRTKARPTHSASAPDVDHATLPPLRTLDGFGVLGAPPATAKAIGPDFSGRGDAEHPPGFYGAPGAETAVQTLAPDDSVRAFDFSKFELSPRPLDRQGAARDLRPLLLTLIFVGLLIDWLALLWLSGRLRLAAGGRGFGHRLRAGREHKRASGARRRAKTAPSAHERDAALKTRLAYVISGDARVDETSRSGLETLSRTLDQRTSFSPGDPVGVDLARDELAFYPMLYWPITRSRRSPRKRPSRASPPI